MTASSAIQLRYTALTAASHEQPFPISTLPDELLILIFLHLPDLNEVPRLERVCKLFKILSNEQTLWKFRLKSIFSEVAPLEDSPYSIKEQTKIYVTSFNKEMICLNRRKSLLEKRVEILRGTQGNNGLIQKAQSYHQKISEINHDLNTLNTMANDLYLSACKGLTTVIPYRIDYEELNTNPARFFSIKTQQLTIELAQLTGTAYDGTPDSIQANSVLGKLQLKILELKTEYNRQNKFKKVISNGL